MTNATDPRAALFQVAQTANALERLAVHLEATARRLNKRNELAGAALIEAAAGELAHHADALREASGLNAATDANLAELLANPSTR